MKTYTEIVIATYRRAKAGEREPWDFEDYAINKPDPDDWPEDIKGYDWRGEPIPATHIHEPRFGGVYIDLPTDWFGLRFGFTGQFFEGQRGGLECECESGGADEVFGDWADDLKAIGDKLLDGEIEGRRGEPHEVTFLTAWSYSCGTDWDGEFDSEYELLGLIDLSRVKTLIIPLAQEAMSI